MFLSCPPKVKSLAFPLVLMLGTPGLLLSPKSDMHTTKVSWKKSHKRHVLPPNASLDWKELFIGFPVFMPCLFVATQFMYSGVVYSHGVLDWHCEHVSGHPCPWIAP